MTACPLPEGGPRCSLSTQTGRLLSTHCGHCLEWGTFKRALHLIPLWQRDSYLNCRPFWRGTAVAACDGSALEVSLIRKQKELASLLTEVRACSACAIALPLGPRPILQLASTATILIASQAPGSRAHETGVPFSDESGERLREWMGLSTDEFYDEDSVAILPMGFCYPGRLNGGDAPPRPECARLWRNELLQLLPAVRLTLLVGSYAQQHVLGPGPITPRVRNFRDYLPNNFPLPHPSWRSRIWENTKPWFREDVMPALRSAVEDARRSER